MKYFKTKNPWAIGILDGMILLFIVGTIHSILGDTILSAVVVGLATMITVYYMQKIAIQTLKK